MLTSRNLDAKRRKRVFAQGYSVTSQNNFYSYTFAMRSVIAHGEFLENML